MNFENLLKKEYRHSRSADDEEAWYRTDEELRHDMREEKIKRVAERLAKKYPDAMVVGTTARLMVLWGEVFFERKP